MYSKGMKITLKGQYYTPKHYCLIPDKIHTPTTVEIGNSRGVGGQSAWFFRGLRHFPPYKYCIFPLEIPDRWWGPMDNSLCGGELHITTQRDNF